MVTETACLLGVSKEETSGVLKSSCMQSLSNELRETKRRKDQGNGVCRCGQGTDTGIVNSIAIVQEGIIKQHPGWHPLGENTRLLTPGSHIVQQQ